MIVIHPKYLPTVLPVWPTLTTYLVLDTFAAPDIVKGCVWTVWALVWIAVLGVRLWHQESGHVLFKKPD